MYGMICQIGRTGERYGNAPMKSFWGLLKNELPTTKTTVHTLRLPQVRQNILKFSTIGKGVGRHVGVFRRRLSPEAGCRNQSHPSRLTWRSNLTTYLRLVWKLYVVFAPFPQPAKRNCDSQGLSL